MKLLILLSAIILVRATSVPENCNGVRIANSPVLYEREVVKTGLGPSSYFMLAVDHNTNTLYFTYSPDYENSIIPAKMNLNNKELKNITSVPEGLNLAVDSKSSEVYISGRNGTYKYNPKTDTAELYLANQGEIIASLNFHDYLYYTVSPSEFVYVVKDGKGVRAADIEGTEVYSFVIDKDDDIFYSNRTGLYGQKKGTKEAELYKAYLNNESVYLTTDKNGIAHIYILFDGIYVVNKDAKRFDKIVNISDPYIIAFDKDNNIIYGNGFNIYTLKPNPNLTC